jgi:hypothetical protein
VNLSVPRVYLVRTKNRSVFVRTGIGNFKNRSGFVGTGIGNLKNRSVFVRTGIGNYKNRSVFVRTGIGNFKNRTRNQKFTAVFKILIKIYTFWYRKFGDFFGEAIGIDFKEKNTFATRILPPLLAQLII